MSTFYYQCIHYPIQTNLIPNTLLSRFITKTFYFCLFISWTLLGLRKKCIRTNLRAYTRKENIYEHDYNNFVVVENPYPLAGLCYDTYILNKDKKISSRCFKQEANKRKT